MRTINADDVLSIVDDLRDRMTVEGYCAMVERVKELPSAQPEIKPIDYQDCANAMLKMWMDNVLTDGEYNRIMDKLNKFDAERRTDE